MAIKWITIVPMTFVGITTLTAAFLNITLIYIPQLTQDKTYVAGFINLLLTSIIIFSVFVIFYNAIPKWIRTARELRVEKI